ncbi:CDP-diacylglycerol--serine O-phosphatidyltransferase [Allorhodopirellula heiligendammensis]|uniref:CDP-diacylglycerol--serine O-phosphatidyltransferase n=1 Tax=Allorhodopirellula heiligendammensis TaxID=2714739 RepID=A0A5C6C7T6_9BACT|nr:CDP-diacylglycerol--serine O-phosphatidyltransferase [Allorhodopirellula heiligendammensis]TWU18809.1 CDP-alcohol phosphatidyltransferase [Allorhodopirellula heiligendammensis]
MSELKPRHPDSDWTDPDDDSDLEVDQLADEIVSSADVDDDDLARRKMERNRRRRKRHSRKRRRLTLAVLPTVLTLGNGVCGLAAIAIAVSTDTLAWDLETKLYAAGLLIFGGMLFDALDGSAARLTGQASRFGAELDSLCDAVTFGVAPAVIVWRISDALPQRLTWAIGVLFAICVLLRLARFNVETPEDDDHEGFEGLPSPAAAGTLAAFAIAIPDVKFYATSDEYHAWIGSMSAWTLEASHFFIPVLAAVLAFLMVSRFRYPHVFAQLLRGRRTPNQIGQALFAVVGVVLLHWVALPLMLCYFSFGSPLRSLFGKDRRVGTTPSTDSGEHPAAHR